tara:strand:- start:891 stop:1421 length:531 start_codon:yes stop_codon:yes gene_type:complete
MELAKTSNLYSLNKSTYFHLRWIAYIGQLTTILLVHFVLQFKFDYIICILIVFFSILSNFLLKFKIKSNQLNNNFSTFFLIFDILQLASLFYFTGGITNPFIFLIIIPAVFSSQYLHFFSSIILVTIITITLVFLTFFYRDLPHSGVLHFHAPDYYFYSIPLSIVTGLFFFSIFWF